MGNDFEVYRQPSTGESLGHEAGPLVATYLSREVVMDSGQLTLTIDGRLLAAMSVAEIFV